MCRVRLDREKRIRRLTIARDRLSLLREAGERVGSTLDVTRTARELADVAVLRFADFAAVDLHRTLLSGDEPPLPVTEPVALQRVASASVKAQVAPDPGSANGSGDLHAYPPDSVPGRALASGRPVSASIMDKADAAEWLGMTGQRTDTHSGDSGCFSGLAVPLRARGATLGVALFVRETHREPFDELLLAEEIGARSAVCVENARRYTQEHLTALALQHSLLPPGLPEQNAVEAAYRYLPARVGVGGDWYDVIPLSGGRVALVVGDVMGHGVHASATMGRLRTTVHNYAALDLPPEDLLANLDDLVGRLGAEDYIATCLYVVYDPLSCLCTFARAGHPPPALVLPDGTVEFPDIPAGPPFGVGGTPFESVEVTLPEGSRLALYTDGLVEHRDRDIDAGIDMLREVLAHRSDRSPDEMCTAVTEAMPDGHFRDDVVLLVVRTKGLDINRWTDSEVPDAPAGVSDVQEKVLKQLEEWDLAEQAFGTELIVSELVTNAIRNGGAPISLRLLRDDHALIREVSDSSSTSPRLRRAGAADEGGRGLFLVAQLSQRWGSRYTPNGKIIWTEQHLTKDRPWIVSSNDLALTPASPPAGLRRT